MLNAYENPTKDSCCSIIFSNFKIFFSEKLTKRLQDLQLYDGSKVKVGWSEKYFSKDFCSLLKSIEHIPFPLLQFLKSVVQNKKKTEKLW